MVVGVIYQIAEEEKERLDSFEFLGSGYSESEVQVVSGNKVECAFTYFSDPQYFDETLSPYTWYKELVVAGARFHRIPEGYIREVESIEAVEDPDPIRSENNFRLLKKTEGRRRRTEDRGI
jgi:gamma-glutamylcyclotransferase